MAGGIPYSTPSQIGEADDASFAPLRRPVAEVPVAERAGEAKQPGRNTQGASASVAHPKAIRGSAVKRKLGHWKAGTRNGPQLVVSLCECVTCPPRFEPSDDLRLPARTALKLILDNHSALSTKHGFPGLNLVKGFFSKFARSGLRHIRIAQAGA
jgi:hypothetical protein